MSKIMTAEEWIKKFHPNTETFNVARLELELKAYAHYYHSQMTAPQDGFIKVEHFPTGENNSDFPEWLASSVIAGLVESGKTKDEVVNELLISLCVKAAYETGTSPAILDSLRQEKDAVEFAEWIRVNSYEWYETHKAWCNNPNDWENGGEPTYLTTADLYRQFKSK